MEEMEAEARGGLARGWRGEGVVVAKVVARVVLQWGAVR